MVLELPVRNDFHSYAYEIDLDGEVFTLAFDYNFRMDSWMISIRTVTGTELISGVPIQVDWAFLGQYNALSIPQGGFIAIDESGEGKDPDLENFGNDLKLIYEEANA